MSRWRIGKTECSAEAEELFNLLSLLYSLAKAVVYAYGQRERLLLAVGGQGNTEYLTFSAVSTIYMCVCVCMSVYECQCVHVCVCSEYKSERGGYGVGQGNT